MPTIDEFLQDFCSKEPHDSSGQDQFLDMIRSNTANRIEIAKSLALQHKFFKILRTNNIATLETFKNSIYAYFKLSPQIESYFFKHILTVYRPDPIHTYTLKWLIENVNLNIELEDYNGERIADLARGDDLSLIADARRVRQANTVTTLRGKCLSKINQSEIPVPNIGKIPSHINAEIVPLKLYISNFRKAKESFEDLYDDFLYKRKFFEKIESYSKQFIGWSSFFLAIACITAASGENESDWGMPAGIVGAGVFLFTIITATYSFTNFVMKQYQAKAVKKQDMEFKLTYFEESTFTLANTDRNYIRIIDTCIGILKSTTLENATDLIPTAIWRPSAVAAHEQDVTERTPLLLPN